MKILVLKEKNSFEKRVAITPDIVLKYQKLGFEIFIEKDAGKNSAILDLEFEKAGAKIIANVDECLSQVDIIISVQNIEFDLTKIKKDVILIAMLNQHFQKEKIDKIIDAKISAFALESVPRITRAQSMDVLSSQSNLAGYVSVLTATSQMQKCVPMMMTAAGTVAAAKFMILGAGVAGLQAIATAKRLGAIVCAFDVRAAAKEQVQSLGAKFIEVDANNKDAETKCGYAKEMDDEYKKRQEKLILETISKQDVIIATALIPGKKAPILISEEMVKSMKPGSVIVDLAAANGGNCALTKVNEIVEVGGVKIIGYENFPSIVASDASKLYARNIFNFVELLLDKENKQIKINLEDEILKASLVVK